MAGRVSVSSLAAPGSQRRDLVANTCPVSGGYGEVCLAFDGHVAGVAPCPFMYGLQIESGPYYLGEARSIQEYREWLATEELYSARRYTVLCLRQESRNTPHGGRLRS